MLKKEALTLSRIFGSESFAFKGLPFDLTIKIVQVQIKVDPIAKEIEAAEETARKSLMTPRLKELIEKVRGNKIMQGTAEAFEFEHAQEDFNDKFKKAVSAVSDAEKTLDLPSFTEEDFKEICKANTFTGVTPKDIYTLLVQPSMSSATKADPA